MKTSFVNSADGTKLRIGKAGEGPENVLIVPGLAEHMGRYEYVVARLVSAGFSITFLEPRGHGGSGGKRGHVQRWSRLREDVEAAATTIDGPLFLLGHSTGGLISLYTALDGLANGIRGLALSAPNVVDTVDAPIKKAASSLISIIAPTMSFATGLDSSLLSRDPAVGQSYDADPLVYGTITARFFVEMIAAQRRVVAAAPEGVLPLLLMVGEQDDIVDSPSSIAMAKGWKTPATIITYPELYHEIFNEPERDQVLSDLIDWLRTQE